MDEYLSPEDKDALIAFAGPLFAQAKFIDANSIDKDGYQTSRQAHEIQHALERDFQRSTPVRPSQPYHQADPYYPTPPHPIELPPQQYQSPPPPVNDGQLEFKFDQTAQQKTNELLEDISRKLTRLMGMLEHNSNAQTENVTKLKITKDSIQEVPRGIGKNQ